jgi:hypothetical protein
MDKYQKMRNHSKVVLTACVGAVMICALGGATPVKAAKAMPAAVSNLPLSMGGAPTMRRLSEAQYKNAISEVFGSDINVPGRFDPRVREDGLLGIGDSKVNVTPSGFEQYNDRAHGIAAQVLDDQHRSKFLNCALSSPSAFDEACARQFFAKYGRLLFRRPLSDSEIVSVLKLSQGASAASGSFNKGLQSGLSGLLVSPSFIFRIEGTEPDPDHKGLMRLDSGSFATRISFLLWDAPPDDQLLTAAQNGKLNTQAGLAQQVGRLIASPNFKNGVRAFFSDMFAYNGFDGLSKDSKLFPIFSPALRDDAEEQSLRTIVNLLVTKNGDYRDLFTTKSTFLSRSLGALYGVPLSDPGADGWEPYTFAANDPRAGLLTMPAFLMLDPSHEGRSSPTIRGKTVQEDYLCRVVPMPPPNVNFSLVQDVHDPVNKTARERLAAHVQNPVCAGCHKLMDPIGLSFENYDAVGNYRTTENGVPIDASGSIDGKSYRNALELSKVLHDSPSVPACVVQRSFEYGAGRTPTDSEQKWLDYLNANFAKSGYRFPALLRQMATSQAFRAASPAQAAPNPKS